MTQNWNVSVNVELWPFEHCLSLFQDCKSDLRLGMEMDDKLYSKANFDLSEVLKHEFM